MLMHITHPPQIQEYQVRHGTRLRFIANAAVAQDVTYQNLLDTMLFAATTTSGYDLFNRVKVRAVEVWTTPLLGNASRVAVAFDGGGAGLLGDKKWHTDTSMGVQPAHVLARPAKKSLAANFQLSSNASAFFLDCAAGSVVDVELTFVQSAQADVTACQNALVGATVGAMYWRGLDGLASATTKLTPDPITVQ